VSTQLKPVKVYTQEDYESDLRALNPQGKAAFTGSAKRTNKFAADFSQADDMGNDTLMTELENSQVYQGEKQTEQDENEPSETRLGGKREVQPKADMNDMAAISSLTPRLENQQV
jgi:hypothetical protein